MERFDVIRDYCEVNSLTQINNSWVQTAGQSLGVTPQAGDDYEQRVFMAILTAAGTAVGLSSPDGNTTVTATDSALEMASDGELLMEIDGIASFLSDTFVQMMNYDGDTFVRVMASGEVLIETGTNKLSLIGLPTYADNAAALSGGLVATNIYQTPAGDVKIVN